MYASILYELREVDFHARRSQLKGDNNTTTQDEKEETWTRVQVSFAMLMNEIATASTLRHFDRTIGAVIIVCTSECAISASLVQEYEGLHMPVTFTSRKIKANELNYSIVEKEALDLLHMMETCFTMLGTRSLKVLARHSTLS